MIACDFDIKIMFVSSGWEGSATDSRVLRSAMSKGFEVPPGKFYLVDGGYANTSSFLAPYRGVRYHLKSLGLVIEDHKIQKSYSIIGTRY